MGLELPTGFEAMLCQALPDKEVAPLLDSLEWPAHTSIRLNENKKGSLKKELVNGAVEHCKNAFLLKERPLFVADPAFHAGYYYVQEASSTVIGSVVEKLRRNFENNITALDLCAAPGGKSTHIASVLKSGDILVANEVIHSRTPILHENLCKWGAGNHIVTRADAKQLGMAQTAFDLVVADMPCSGEGLFRKDNNATQEWSENNVNICCERQRRIAADIWPVLAEGGYFIYSTCTYNQKENEENVHWILNNFGAELVSMDFPVDWNFYEREPSMYRLLPHRTVGEGFFFAVLRKMDKSARKEQKHSVRLKFSKQYEIYFKRNCLVFEKQDTLHFIESENTMQIEALLSALPAVYSAGTPMGRAFEKGFKPQAELALYQNLNKDSFPWIEVTDKEVMQFLHREAFPNTNKLAGIHLLGWKGISLGFVNGVKQQWNNLWPMEWRIRKDIPFVQTIVEL